MSETGAGISLVALQKRLTLFGLVALAAICWLFLVESEAAMRSMRGDGFIMEMMWWMMAPAEAGPYLAAASLMWVIMMLAMMIPAVLPMASVYRGIYRGTRAEIATLMFASGYLLGWSGFALAAGALQWLLHTQGSLHGHLLQMSPQWAGVLLLAAGVYQFTPLKDACLAHCRSPLGFFMQHWQDGRIGALRMGLHHGLYCIGCCWVLMLLMFAGGAMSVLTMAGLSALILAERLLPAGPWVRKLPGVVLLAWGGMIWWQA